MTPHTKTQEPALTLALEAASRYRGATAPNPPVGAVALDSEGNVLAVGAHERAGLPHAEIRAIEACRAAGTLDQLHTLVVTLEPCNHTGRTGPCTEAILRTPVKRVLFGCEDPNPKVSGRGAARLYSAGLEVTHLNSPECRELIAPFAKWITTGIPWVTVKVALNSKGSPAEGLQAMVPESGHKTFTSPESLRLAHELRRRADAILTGSGTVLADAPEFTVRNVPDHPGKRRFLAVLDRRDRIPREWLLKAEERGFQVVSGLELEPILKRLGELGAHEVLVEAGPTLTRTILDSGLWDEEIRIEVQGEGQPDRVTRRYRVVHGNR